MSLDQIQPVKCMWCHEPVLVLPAKFRSGRKISVEPDPVEDGRLVIEHRQVSYYDPDTKTWGSKPEARLTDYKDTNVDIEPDAPRYKSHRCPKKLKP